MDEDPGWQWDKVSGDKPRNFAGSFILLSDKPAQKIMEFVQVDMRTALQGIIWIKQMQELHTSMDFILLGAHANTNSEAVARDLRKGMATVEGDALARKMIFEDEGLGVVEANFKYLDFDWKDLDFPEVVCIRSYPKAMARMKSLNQTRTHRGRWLITFKLQICDVVVLQLP
jgi:lipopolysaccharide export LptBFGC system permease protein LptF